MTEESIAALVALRRDLGLTVTLRPDGNVGVQPVDLARQHATRIRNLVGVDRPGILALLRAEQEQAGEDVAERARRLNWPRVKIGSQVCVGEERWLIALRRDPPSVLRAALDRAGYG